MILVKEFEVSMELIGQVNSSSKKVKGIADENAFH